MRGILEALLPGLVFLVVYSSLTSFGGQDPQAALIPALAASVGLAVVFTVVRIATKGQPTQAIAGLIGVLASAALALWTGDARDNYVLGFFTNAAYALALIISLLVRWPAIGLIVGFLMGDGVAWKQDRREVPCHAVPHARLDRPLRRAAWWCRCPSTSSTTSRRSAPRGCSWECRCTHSCWCSRGSSSAPSTRHPPAPRSDRVISTSR